MKQITQPVEWYKSHFEAFERSLNGDSHSSLHQLRKAAMERFGDAGFPTTRNEEWKFTNVGPIAKIGFEPVFRHTPGEVKSSDIAPFELGSTIRLVFVNGHFAQELSTTSDLPQGVYCGSLASALKASHPKAIAHLGTLADPDATPFVALNTAFLIDGAFIYVPDNIIVETPLHLLFLVTNTDASLLSPRNLFVVGKHGQATIVESYRALKESQYLTNAVTEVVVGEGALVEHDKLQDEGPEAFHVAMTHVHLSGKATFTSNSIALGGSIVRNNVTAVLDDEGCECTLNGLSLATGTQLIDNHTTIDHARPHCASHELYKAILDGASRGVFNGKIFVREDAQKTDAKQTNKTLLLSDDATMDTKPQLEIFADDVKCTHGATVGQLDAEQVFYLRSRGIDEAAARDILTFAFASDVVRRVHDDDLRRRLENMIHARLIDGRVKGVA